MSLYPEKKAGVGKSIRFARRKKSLLAEATPEELREMNEVTKKERGIGNFTLKDIYGDEEK
jgi:hypothetical protein